MYKTVLERYVQTDDFLKCFYKGSTIFSNFFTPLPHVRIRDKDPHPLHATHFLKILLNKLTSYRKQLTYNN